MSNIKLVIFDLSGVCFDIEEPPYLENFIKEHKLESRREEFLARYDELLMKAEVGKLEGIKLWEMLLAKYGISADPRQIIRDMMDLKIPHPDVLAFAKELKKNYTVVYITNYNKDYWDEILRRFDFSKWFSWGLVSYEIGFRKPAREGFEFVLKKADVKPEEAVFTDDTVKNLDEPASLGLHTIEFQDKKSLIENLKDLNLIDNYDLLA